VTLSDAFQPTKEVALPLTLAAVELLGIVVLDAVLH